MKKSSALFSSLLFFGLPTLSTAAETKAQKQVKPEKALLFLPSNLQQNLDKKLLARLLKLPSNLFFENGTEADLEKVLLARQDFASQTARERITTVAIDLLRPNSKKTDAQKSQQLAEIEQIAQQATTKGWYGPFIAIRHFTVGLVKSDANAVRLLFANSEDFPTQFPVALRDTVDLNKAEWLANILKLNRSTVRTRVTLANATDWPQAKFCSYHLNGQTFNDANNLVIAGAKHQLIEHCVDGTQRVLDFELKPFQRDALLSFSSSDLKNQEKISAKTWAAQLASQNVHGIVVASTAANPNIVLATFENKSQISQQNIEIDRVRTFESPVEDTSLEAGLTTVEVFPTLWIGAGRNRTIFVNSLPEGNFLGLGLGMRHSDFSVSFDAGFAGFDDVETAAWIFARGHWAKEFSFDGLRGVQLRPLIGLGVLLVPESSIHNDLPMFDKIYGSVGLILSYSLSEQFYMGLGGEFNASLGRFEDRLFGLSLRVGYRF